MIGRRNTTITNTAPMTVMAHAKISTDHLQGDNHMIRRPHEHPGKFISEDSSEQQ